MPSSLRNQIEPWPAADLASDDPVSTHTARVVMDNTAHLVDSQCQCLVTWVQRSGVYRTTATSTTRPLLAWRALVPVTRRPDGRYAQWVVQLFVSSATAGSVTWYVGARTRGDMRPVLSGETDDSEAINSTTPVWTPPMLVRPSAFVIEDRVPSSVVVGTTPDLVQQVGVGYAEVVVSAFGSVVPRLSGVSVREFGGT